MPGPAYSAWRAAVADVRALPTGCTIRPAVSSDLPHLPRIEREAAKLFGPYSSREVGDHIVTDDAALVANAASEGRLWVCSCRDELVGFALATIMDSQPHLHEIDVLPAHGRQGIGAALVETVCRWAVAQGSIDVTLSTRMDVPFNGPFYAKLGFERVPDHELQGEVRALRAAEVERGLDAEHRAIMRRWLQLTYGLGVALVRPP